MGKIGGKSQNSVHPVITYQTLLIASSWSSFFWGLQDLVPSSFSGIPYLSGKKACIVLKKTGLGLFQVLLSASCINQENHFTATTHFIISPYLAGWNFLTAYFCILRSDFPRSRLFPTNCQHCDNFPSFLPLPYLITRYLCWQMKVGPAGISLHSVPTSQDVPSLPETAQALFRLYPALPPLAPSGSLFQSHAAQVAGKHLLISWLCLLVTSLYAFVLLPALPFASFVFTSLMYL